MHSPSLITIEPFDYSSLGHWMLHRPRARTMKQALSSTGTCDIHIPIYCTDSDTRMHNLCDPNILRFLVVWSRYVGDAVGVRVRCCTLATPIRQVADLPSHNHALHKQIGMHTRVNILCRNYHHKHILLWHLCPTTRNESSCTSIGQIVTAAVAYDVAFAHPCVDR